MATVMWCTGYMLADSVYMLIWAPHETLFLLHHTATCHPFPRPH